MATARKAVMATCGSSALDSSVEAAAAGTDRTRAIQRSPVAVGLVHLQSFVC